MKKAVRKNGQTLLDGLLGGLASTLATLAKTDAPGGSGKSNLGMLAENIKEALSQQQGGKHHHRRHEQHDHHGHRGRKREERDSPMDHHLASAPS